ncbi:transcriptional repressor [Clostridium sp. cel8]|jgi:Fur family transcriptional regulator, ferric uptake regulator|uniref:Fur family transcriptional regulator n=1 Tax=unclassified Clostridium TaxID=2614128 RepID=UPI0015F76ADC|nr:Fur family transcriptional regulator [Clostridium sp. cel8]MBA5850006.1 transcriptional repressor [Clostridium sp. cel8]
MINVKDDSIARFKEVFEKNGHKFTKQRRLIISILYENIGKYLSMKDIYDISKEKGYSMGIATIYRTLMIMEKFNAVTSVMKDDGANKCELYEINTDNEFYKRPHLICRKCGKIVGIYEEALIKDLINEISKKYNFKVEDIKIDFYGICKECMNEQK